ncbi:MAG: DUF7210 family protein [Stenotrophomonas sp.]|uniref:DUF7210 family protein n=1 Tax=Stenotrophomonas sp. TaxID=69392 RepID=UPI003D6D6E6D
MSEKPEPKQVEVTLAKSHTHAGAAYEVGAKIKVTEPERDWLVAQEVVAATKEK